MRALPLALCLALTVTGCARLSGSGLNPSNWFASGGGGARVQADGTLEPLVPAGARGLVLDARQPVAEITGVALERTPDGAILRATGLARTQGWFNAQLVLTAVEGRTATYVFRAEPPRTAAASGSAASRSITAATELSLAELAGISRFVVQGAGNSRAVGR